ncbi:hypothetical protein [Campylobacter majalis]|uniref:hypothetical protein n=1 Tax=Campylobacter majalis TaxID=2790656 RepID=UPI003D6887DE
MYIKCKKCGHKEKTNVSFFVKIIGASLPAGGFYAWVTYLFAGTGLAMPICIAIATGGIAMLCFKDEIVAWIIEKGHQCEKCGSKNWQACE